MTGARGSGGAVEATVRETEPETCAYCGDPRLGWIALQIEAPSGRSIVAGMVEPNPGENLIRAQNVNDHRAPGWVLHALCMGCLERSAFAMTRDPEPGVQLFKSKYPATREGVQMHQPCGCLRCGSKSLRWKGMHAETPDRQGVAVPMADLPASDDGVHTQPARDDHEVAFSLFTVCLRCRLTNVFGMLRDPAPGVRLLQYCRGWMGPPDS